MMVSPVVAIKTVVSTRNRIDSKKNTDQKIERIEISVGGEKYTITEYFGRLKIHAHNDSISINPCCANEITLAGKENT